MALMFLPIVFEAFFKLLYILQYLYYSAQGLLHSYVLFACCSFASVLLFAASGHLPEVSDHHADPDPGSVAVCCTTVSYGWGMAHRNTFMLYFEKKNKGWSVFQWYADLSTERSPGYTTFAQLLGGQSAPADRPAGLQGAQQGLFTAS